MTQDRLWELLAKKLSGEATLPELEELQQLLRKSPDMHYPLQTISDLWFLTPNQPEDTQAAYERHLNRLKTQLGEDWSGTGSEPDREADSIPEISKATEDDTENFRQIQRRRKRRLGWAGLGIAAIIGSAIYFASPLQTPQGVPASDSRFIAEVSTRNGSKSKIQLPDGTQVWLNSGSKLTYGKEFNGTQREVNLTGEAFFDVVKDSLKPFIIHARNVNIRVVGTAFNVKSYPGDKTTETSLIRGIIEVNINNRPAEKIILKPNEKLVVASDDSLVAAQPTSNGKVKEKKMSPQVVIDNISYLPSDSTVIETSWMENKLIFTDESFRELANRMERWFGVVIRFEKPELEQIRLTGTFQGETLQQALRALTITAPFSYSINKDKVTISTKP
ncbi:FecR family protein [Flavihumibacter petaseus]|uniref:Putative anti-sigma factor n=1 Tax=Flavihumibacter petaseus NBRC 106054 TaxID=1220578 RepID=A0A0E9MYG1_9BACT|nr:FecR domain-containing protein [Flavihumibacter petaseus]GAO42772.1 putative anti-sigma factor [Flavihumibacter petaseus NBRC 106054]